MVNTLIVAPGNMLAEVETKKLIDLVSEVKAQAAVDDLAG